MERLQSTYEKLFNAFKIKMYEFKIKINVHKILTNNVSYSLIRTCTCTYKRVRNAWIIGKFCVRTL